MRNNALEVTLSNNPDRLTFVDKFFCFAMLDALFVPGQSFNVLIAHDQ